MKTLRRHLSYANVAATLALLFAMSGGALAAQHYLVNSTKQINPKVLKKLKGNRGPRGAGGAQGLTGPRGGTGPQGAKGTDGTKGTDGAKGTDGVSALNALPSGKSESGHYGLRTTNAKSPEFIDDSISFPIPLQEGAPASQIVYTKINAPVPHCGGPGQAEKGFVCIYSFNSGGVKVPPTFIDAESEFGTGGTGRFGVDMEWTTTSTNPFDVGTYTVTAG